MDRLEDRHTRTPVPVDWIFIRLLSTTATRRPSCSTPSETAVATHPSTQTGPSFVSLAFRPRGIRPVPQPTIPINLPTYILPASNPSIEASSISACYLKQRGSACLTSCSLVYYTPTYRVVLVLVFHLRVCMRPRPQETRSVSSRKREGMGRIPSGCRVSRRPGGGC